MTRLWLLILLIKSVYDAVLSTYLPLPIPQAINGSTEELWIYMQNDIQDVYHIFYEENRTEVQLTSGGVNLLANWMNGTDLSTINSITPLTGFPSLFPKTRKWMHIASSFVYTTSGIDCYLYLNGYKIDCNSTIPLTNFTVLIFMLTFIAWPNKQISFSV